MGTNLTAVDAANDIVGFTQAINTASGNLYALFILAAIFIFGLMSLRKYGWDKAFAASTFISTLIGFMFVYLEMISFDKLIYFIVAFIISLIFTIWNVNNA
jgi:hypothetical protein